MWICSFGSIKCKYQIMITLIKINNNKIVINQFLKNKINKIMILVLYKHCLNYVILNLIKRLYWRWNLILTIKLMNKINNIWWFNTS